MKSNQLFITFAILVMALLLGACTSAKASQATKLDSQIPVVTVKTTDYAFEAPAQIEAGLVSFVLENEGQELHHAQLARLNDGVTMDQFQAALQQSPEAAFPLVAFVGGPGLVDPGLNSQVTLELTPGQYVLLCFVPSHDGVPHLAKGMIKPIEVVAASEEGGMRGSELQVDATIRLMDFSFVLPAEVKAGQQLWQVVNEGTQPHEIMLMKLAEGKTIADAQAFAEHPHGVPPFASIGGFQAINPGSAGWLNLDLEPGDYIAICHIPDPASGHAHSELGMVMPFTVK